MMEARNSDHWHDCLFHPFKSFQICQTFTISHQNLHQTVYQWSSWDAESNDTIWRSDVMFTGSKSQTLTKPNSDSVVNPATSVPRPKWLDSRVKMYTKTASALPKLVIVRQLNKCSLDYRGSVVQGLICWLQSFLIKRFMLQKKRLLFSPLLCVNIPHT